MAREYRLIDDRSLFSLLERPPRNHPGGRTNTLRFGGGHKTGDYERELAVPLCHCLTPNSAAGVVLILPIHYKIYDTHVNHLRVLGSEHWTRLPWLKYRRREKGFQDC